MRRKHALGAMLLASPFFAVASGPAAAQALPLEPGNPLERVIDRQVFDQVERGVEGQALRRVEQLQLPDLPAELADPLLAIPEQVTGKAGEILEAVPGAARDLAALPGILRAGAGRPIDLDTVNGVLVVRDEWVVLAAPEDARRIASSGVRILEDTPLVSSGEHLMVVSVSSDDPGRNRVEALLQELGAEISDRNHVYMSASPPKQAPASPGAPPPLRKGSYAPMGLIDTDVDETHSAFRNFPLTEQDFVTLGDLRPQGHGTAVASILARQLPAPPGGGPALRAASVFFLADDGTTGASSASLVRAVDWMISEDVAVINFSLTGPPNKPLERIIRQSLEAGIVVVAAVGNEGPAARPSYPAAYPGVIGVTAVDRNGKVYRWANRGSYVSVAALGVDVEVARPGGSKVLDSGTSFAAPLVSAWIAEQLASEKTAPPLSLLQAAAKPAGKQSRDEITGYGILSPATGY